VRYEGLPGDVVLLAGLVGPWWCGEPTTVVPELWAVPLVVRARPSRLGTTGGPHTGVPLQIGLQPQYVVVLGDRSPEMWSGELQHWNFTHVNSFRSFPREGAGAGARPSPIVRPSRPSEPT
jgi:hypothetical protein